MSFLFSSMEITKGPTVGVKESQVNLAVFLIGDQMENVSEIIPATKAEDLVSAGVPGLQPFSIAKIKSDQVADDGEGSSESSSIGSASSSSSEEVEEEEEDEGGDEEQSKPQDEGSFASLDTLEDSLPIKRGLSNFFVGKSKSFASLADAAACNARDLAKPENPFNKRRRILMASKASWSRRASYGSLIVSLPPLLSPDHVVNEGEVEEDCDEEETPLLAPLPNPPSGRNRGTGFSKAFKSPRSFSLSDLQHL